MEHAAAHPHLEDGSGIQRLLDLHVDGPEQHNHTVYLHTAGAGSGAAADETHQHQHEARQHGPGSVVADGKAGGRSVTHHVESAVHKRLAPVSVNALELERERSDDGKNYQRGHVEPQHGVAQRPQRPSHQGHENEAEVDGSQEHEHDGDHVDERGIECADAEVTRGETARRTHGEGMADGIEGAHSRRQVAKESGAANAQVHPCKDGHRLVGAAAVVVAGKRGQFHIGEPQADGRRRGDNEQQEHHDTQAADKVCRRPPEDEASGQGFYIGQNGGAGGGEARDTLEPGVHQRERAAPQRVGHGTEDERQQPGQENDHVAVLQGYLGGLPHEDEGEDTRGESNGEADEQRTQRAVSSVPQGDEGR